MRFCDRHKGAISVFLALILLPVFIFSCIIIDGTRLYSSAAIMSSAGDMAMNAALSDFDLVVQDVYGIMAMSDTPEDMSENVEAYLLDIINRSVGSEASTDSYTLNYIHEICSLLQNYEDATFENIVNIQISNFEAISVPSSSLANPEVLENQIVEYMKYRAPVAMATGLLSKFSQLKDIDKQTDAISAQKTYNETLATMGDSLEKAYTYLEKYLELYTNYNLGDVSIYNTDISGNVKSGMEDALYYITAATSSDITEPIEWNKDSDESIAKAVDLAENFIGSMMGPVTTAIEDGKDSADPDDADDTEAAEFEDFFKDMMDYLINKGFVNFDSNGKLTTSTLQDVYNNLNGLSRYNGDDLDITIIEILVYQGFITDDDNIENLHYALALYRAYEYYCEMGYDANETAIGDWDWAYFDTMMTWLTDAVDICSAASGYTVWSSIESALENKALEELNAVRTNSVYYRAIEAKWYLYASYLWLGEAVDNVDQLDTDRASWSTSVNALSDGETKTSMSAQVADSETTVTVEKLDTLRNLLRQEISYYDAVIDEYEKINIKINGTEYAIFTSESTLNSGSSASGKEYGWFKSGDALIDACSSTAPVKVATFSSTNIPKFTISNVQDMADKYEAAVGEDGIDLKTAVNGNEAYSLDLFYYYTNRNLANYANYTSPISISASSDVNAIKDDELYKYLVECYDLTDKPTSEGTTLESELSSQLSSASSNTDTTVAGYQPNTVSASDISTIFSSIQSTATSADDGLDTISTTSISESTNSDDGKKYSETANSAWSLIESAKATLKSLGNLMKTERDILYVGTYMTEMFSCATTNIDDGNAITDASKMETTLSGYTLSSFNNYCYQQELEYILWGNSDLATNVNYTKTLIYALRFTLNTIYAFTASDIQSMTNAAATCLSCGIPFLQPIINVVLTLAVSATESAYDLKELMDGNDVVIYKSASTWTMSGIGLFKTAATAASTAIIENVFDKIEEVATGEVDKLAQIGEDYVDETVESVKSTVTSTVISPIITRLSTYATSLDEFGTTQETEVRNIVTNCIDTMKSSISGDSVVAQAELAALEYLESNVDTLFVNKIKEYVSEKAGYSSANDAVLKLQEKLNSITDSIGTKVEEIVKEKINSAATTLNNKISEACATGEDTAKEKTTDAINEFMSDVTMGSAAGTVGDMATSDISNSGSIGSTLTLNYKEYLTAFIFIAMQGEDNRNTMIERMAVLMQMNISKTQSSVTQSSDQKNISKNTDFTMTGAYTMLVIKADYTIKTLLFSSSYTGELDINGLGTEDGVTRSYASVMGY